MQTYKGKSVFGGIAIGRIRVYQKNRQQVRRTRIEDTEAELARYERARIETVNQLKVLYEKALVEVGEENAAIFEIHGMMLEDGDYNESVQNMIQSNCINAEFAVAATGDNLSQMFAAMQDEYMRARAADIKDITERIIGNLQGTAKEDKVVGEPAIIVAEDLAPSETVQLDKKLILSFVTIQGSPNSHTAILARTMGIPALVGTSIPPEADLDGKMAIVDGTTGVLYVEPEEGLLREMEGRKEEEVRKRELLLEMKGQESITADGHRIRLYANIGNIDDLAAVLENDAEGIGLFRSEFLYLQRDTYPTEDEQFAIYKKVAETMAGKTAIIRTLDIGADKQCEYFGLEKEENPALGCRAIRICLKRPEIFKTQLRALYRASAFGRLAIMYPMIISPEEVRRIKKITEEVKRELRTQGIEYGEPEQGIMIETPAAVMMSRELAREVDFFSIGTNDLTQYTLAIDRQNQYLEEFYDPHHPAILRMIEMTVQNAHAEGIWVGICGELGGDREVTDSLLRMGVDELSVSPGNILPLRKAIRETQLREGNTSELK
ncbi:MAG: phosphoenolpyruvate--protein phosphotransferase [Acetatifactor sp.]